jgi:hypothetical protein
MHVKITPVAVAIAALAAGCGSEASGTAGPGRPAAAAAAPRFDPANFVARVDNPWFPLPPGRTLRYRGHDGKTRARDVFTVTRRTTSILGVEATVVHDRVIEHGRTTEDTLDYYAQDEQGTVWYLGEDTAELDRKGRVKTREGTWRAGVHGADPGVFMPARPRVGQSFRQEHDAGHAEDHFAIVSLHARVAVPAVTTGSAMRTREWSPLEPGVRDAKYYVRGFGTVLERTVKGASERWELASVRR